MKMRVLQGHRKAKNVTVERSERGTVQSLDRVHLDPCLHIQNRALEIGHLRALARGGQILDQSAD